MAEKSWPEFTDEYIRQIAAWLPEGVDPRQHELLPQIIREWASVDLRQHYAAGSPASIRGRRLRLAQLGRLADRLLQALDGLDARDRLTLAAQIGIVEGQSVFEAIPNEENTRHLVEWRDFVATLADACRRPLSKPRRGQPRNRLAYLVMMDVAAIFEYLTETEATRQVDRDTNEETGPFRDFAGAIWSILFTSDEGLSAALKN
jgi:hypothetical protein